MSKIVICSREWSGSTGRYARALVEHLQDIDTKNQYIILLKPEDAASWQPKNPRFSVLACPHKEFSFDEQFGLKKQLEILRPDLVHFTMVQQPAWYGGKVVTTMQDLTTIRFRNLSKNPIVFAIKQQVYRWLNKKVAKKSVAIITPSQFVRLDVASFTRINPDKITVTHEGADRITNNPEPVKGLEKAQFIMYLGRPMTHKNLPRLIEAFKKLQIDRPELRLVLAGKKDDNYQKIERVVAAQGTKNVAFTDYVSEGQLRWLYEHCAAYVFPSLSEGFGLPGLEAMAHGAPVISSNATCLPEIYGDAVYYFDPVNIDDMAKKIGEVLDSERLRQELIAAGNLQVDKYSWRRMAKQTLAVYEQALKHT
jgi:glycosyltransferase involved in cell wall biosynthesis